MKWCLTLNGVDVLMQFSSPSLIWIFSTREWRYKQQQNGGNKSKASNTRGALNWYSTTLDLRRQKKKMFLEPFPSPIAFVFLSTCSTQLWPQHASFEDIWVEFRIILLPGTYVLRNGPHNINGVPHAGLYCSKERTLKLSLEEEKKLPSVISRKVCFLDGVLCPWTSMAGGLILGLCLWAGSYGYILVGVFL